MSNLTPKKTSRVKNNKELVEDKLFKILHNETKDVQFKVFATERQNLFWKRNLKKYWKT